MCVGGGQPGPGEPRDVWPHGCGKGAAFWSLDTRVPKTSQGPSVASSAEDDDCLF